MTYQDILNTIQENHQNNLKAIERYVNANEPYEQDFKKLVQWIVDNFEYSYSYAPSWCYNFNDAGTFAGFLSTLHHAMIDDGDVCFVNVESMHPFIVFIDKWETATIKSYLDTIETIQIKNDCSLRFNKKHIPIHETFDVHTDVDRFISDCEEYNKG